MFMLISIMGCRTMKQTLSVYDTVIAHRGAWKVARLPQNSTAALQQVLVLTCGGSEFDVRMTADSVLVVEHDPTFFGDTIELKTYQELSRHVLKNGEKLPTLRDYILAGKLDNTQTWLVLEVKPSITNKEQGIRAAEKAVRMVRELQARDLVVYISFDFEILKRIHELDPEADTQYLAGDKTPAQVKAAGITGIDYHFKVYQNHPEWIVQARENNLMLNAWTVNDTTIMDWLLSECFNFITTDQPEVLIERIRQRKLK